MTTSVVRTFFSYPYSEVTTVEQAISLFAHIPATAEIVLIQDSAKPQAPLLKRALEARSGTPMRIRTSGPWNKLWKFIQGVEIESLVTGKYSKAGELWFVSMIPSGEIHAAMKRHRVVANITNRESFWLKSLAFGEEHDDIIAMTLNTELGYVTDKPYRDLTTFEAFEMSSFEGLRFMRPCHDVQTCAAIMASYEPPKLKGEKYIAPTPPFAIPA